MTDPAISQLVAELATLPGSDRLTNPYAPGDRPGADVRQGNLARYLSDMQAFSPRLLLMAEAPGYNGCLLTGIPVTSERIMIPGIAKWALFGEGYRPTSGHPDGVAEMTATILWNALSEHLETPPVIWNSVPLHPHRPGEVLSNRTPTVGEIHMGQPFIEAVLALFPITTVLGVGRKAQRSLRELGIEHVELRHPSQGGKADFIAGLVKAAG